MKETISMMKMLGLFMMVILMTLACDGGNRGCGGFNSTPTPTPEPTPDTTPVPTPNPDSTAVSLHGQLRVEGTQLVDQYGDPVQLKGMSSHWVNWFPEFVNEDAIGWLVENKKMTLFRVAMGVEPEGAYLDLQTRDFIRGKVVEAVDACIKLGIYVIIDWHDHHAYKNENEAQEFFHDMAVKYKGTPNVLYEVFNEPLDKDIDEYGNEFTVTWKDVVKPYAQKMVNTIRDIDTDNIILVSTPEWCQQPEQAANSPIEGSNIMYTLHFYATSHGSYLRDRADKAMKKIPIFVSEWGASYYTGNGGFDRDAAEEWIKWMNGGNSQNTLISWAAWNLADKFESTSILKVGTSPCAYGTGIGETCPYDTTGSNETNIQPWSEDVFKGHGPFVLEKMEEVNPYITQ